MTEIETTQKSSSRFLAFAKNLGRWQSNQWVGIFLFLALIFSTVVSYTPYPLSWDESYYLQHAICGNQAVYDLSLSELNDCLKYSHKGPIVEFLNLPWGKAGGTERGIGLAFLSLTLLIWILVLLTYLANLWSGISPVSLLLAACTICLTPFLRASAGAMMTDALLAWSVALFLMLIPLEYVRPSRGIWPSILRGLLWSVPITVGMLSKVTFLFFLVLAGMALLMIRTDNSGETPVRYAAIGTLLGALPAIVLWRFYGLTFLRFAVYAAWSPVAGLWNVPGMTPFGYLVRYFRELGFALIPLSILVVMFIRGIMLQRECRFARVLPLVIIVMYLGIAARSKNRDPRFSIPVMIAMPLCLAWNDFRKDAPVRLNRTVPLLGVVIAGMFSIPMVGRPELTPIRHAKELVENLSAQIPSMAPPAKILIATDGPAFNIDTFLLAKQLGGKPLKPVVLDTLVYDAMTKRTLQDGLGRIRAADFVLFLKPGITPGPDWSRVYVSQYRAECEKIGSLMDSNTSPEFEVFKIRGDHPE